AGAVPAHADPVGSEMPVLRVGRDQDLRRVLQEAPSGSIVEISGEYRPQAFHIIDDTAGIRIEGKRLVLRAAPGSRPRLVLYYDDDAVRVADWTLFTLVGSQVEFEGISFETDST